MDESLFIGRPSTGKARLPLDADIAAFVSQLRRAELEIGMREGGARPIADYPLYVLSVDPEQLRARHPDSEELHQLLDIVASRGPAVDVVMKT